MEKNNILERVTPEQVGIYSKGVLSFLDSVQDKKINLHSFMLLRHGKVAVEGYYKPFGEKMLHNIYSVSKSFTSAAIGIAIGEGLLSLEDKVVDFFPEKLTGEVHKYTAMMKVKHLLSMATVHAKSTDTSAGDWVKSFLNTPPTHVPGTIFAYDTTGTHTLCAIIQKVTGMTVHEYLRTRLFNPIGIGEIEWESCPMNINKGGSGIKCTTEDLARFGQLYLQNGCWNGVQILPKGWAEISTARHIDNSNTKMMLDGKNGYGYQFWRMRNNSYCAFGMGGQFVIIVPDKDVVFISTANTMLYKDAHQQIIDSFWETLYPAISDASVEENRILYSEMKERLSQLTSILPEGEISSTIAQGVSEKMYKLDKNYLDYDTCEFIFNDVNSRLSFHKDKERFDLNFGMKQWASGKNPFLGLDCASAATWVDERTCIIYTHIFACAQMFILTCSFEEGIVVIQIQAAGEMKADKIEGFLNGSVI